MSQTAPTVPLPGFDAPLSPLGAIVGTFLRPSGTFERLVRRPTWWLPFVLSVAATSAILLVSTPKIDLARTIRETMEKRAERTGQSVSPEAVARQVEVWRRMQPVFLGIGLLLGAGTFFVLGPVLWGAARAMGADARYREVLAIWAHASLPNLAAALLAIPLFATVTDSSLTQSAAQGVVASNLGAFLPETAPAPLRALLSSVDVLSAATVVLLVLGFRKLPGLSKGAATATPVVLWLVWVAGKTAWAAVFG